MSRMPWTEWLEESEVGRNSDHFVCQALHKILEKACKRGAALEKALEKKGIYIPGEIYDSKLVQTCEHCGIEFQIKTPQPHRKYCLEECRKLARAARRKAKASTRHGIKCMCKCGTLYVKKSWNQRHCSDACRRKEMNTRRRKEHAERRKKELTEKRCAYCGISFTPGYRQDQQYHSSRCAAKARAAKKKAAKGDLLCARDGCTNIFKPRHSRARYCSDKDCRRVRRNEEVKRYRARKAATQSS